MLILLSPAKALDFETPATTHEATTPVLLKEASGLINILKNFSPAQVASLMSLSDKLALLNVGRYAAWDINHTADNAKQAILAFNGDVYEGLHAPSLTLKQLEFAQKHLRILSGLYGLLKPLDLIEPYRLEMGTALANSEGKDLYAYWQKKLPTLIMQEAQATAAKAILNLASEEYFKAACPAQLTLPIISPVFQDEKNGQYKVISFYAKRARGLMARYVIEHKITNPDKICDFQAEGYAYDALHSSPDKPVFRRPMKA